MRRSSRMPRIPSVRVAIAATAMSAAMLAGTAAGAANLQISPVSIAFQPSQAASGINLQNYGETPLYGQVRVYAWDQKDGVDVLTPTTDLVASPPVIEVAPNSAQTIRLVRRASAPAGVERSYRILIDEIPRGDAASGVAIRLQYSVPVFVAGSSAAAAPAVTWTLVRKDGDTVLRAANGGTLHAQLGATRLRTEAGQDVEISKGLLGYALAGRSREWKLAQDKAAGLQGKLTVITTVNTREEQFPVVPDGN
ncbi:fimbria/pilus periplasmic chaperone [Massilia sp. YIM B02763]|uniref:fimbrial biogenesis chaperone n=1 Tax=Massilia sp. YIM B02763 TaxID=3050130 RepID=UPI0025B66C8C|nr:fimbria/pilus periplasmic chaperone [Massilia sp. YIM B02763]MDN4053859.1 fimbria/pilus periplasmic chaperone [Massilia sp. YIM B02763]